MLKQLSIFAENKKGTMQQITQILFENDVNILGSVNNDSAEYGIVRMVVSDPDKAEQALQAAGYMTRQTDVLGVEVVDQPGNLNSLLKTLLETNIDIDYIYLSFNRESGCPIMVFHVPDVYETEASLKSKGYTRSLKLLHYPFTVCSYQFPIRYAITILTFRCCFFDSCSTVRACLKKTSGEVIFHPCRCLFSISSILFLHPQTDDPA